MQYTTTQGGNITYSSLVIKNNFWPGSTTVYRQGEFTTIYLGNGNRQYGSIYYPYKPGEIENDPEGLSEYREPNPDKEPEIIESDSDRENEEMEMNDGK